MNVGELFEPDEAMHVIALRELRADAGAMLFQAPDDVVRDADVQRASRSTCEDEDPELAHRLPPTVEYAEPWIPGTSPGMTVWGC